MAALREIAFEFAKIGLFAFGGPAAHIAMMEQQLVVRKGWISREEFLDMMGATNLIPGPNSTELAIHIGYRKRGIAGLLVAGVSFILPAFLMVWCLAWTYVTYGSLPEVQKLFLAVTPVILAVIVQAIWGLGKSAVKDQLLLVLSIVSLLAYFLLKQEILILFIVAFLNYVIRKKWTPSKLKVGLFFMAVFTSARAFAQQVLEKTPAPEEILLFFSKIGSILFGSGYVLIAFLQSDLVERYHWLTQQQLIDAITVGQVTPGPVFTTATFIGYVLGGHLGAVSATVGIFLPAFVFVALSAPFIPRMRKSVGFAQFLDGLNVSSLSLMVGAAVILGGTSLASIYGVLVFLFSLLLLLRFKMNSVWLVLFFGLLSFII
ncbi:chromate efflux transporter [Bdellovibrio sp. HCB2-146]|uniref:chromate efflux transporter n=1 Tax=Bdellovibrio sp. HCB2-146 TaxID=3394362 RepID=UPI0039BD5E1A